MSNTLDLMFKYNGVKVSILQREKKVFSVLYILFWVL